MSNIDIFYEDLKPLKLPVKHIKNAIKALVNKELKNTGTISLIFCSDNYLLNMNRVYLNHNYFTDIITFNYVEGNVISGDLFISVDRVKENAVQFNTFWLNELYRVIFHGVLHLLGYDDKEDSDKKKMRLKEDFYLSEVDFNELKV